MIGLSRNILSSTASSVNQWAALFTMPWRQPVYARTLHMTVARLAANSQSDKPDLDPWSHTKKNIKEEAKAVKSSVESMIAGGTSGSNSEVSKIIREAKSITSVMAQQVPRPVLMWGVAGVLPYVSTAAASIWLARQEYLVEAGLQRTMDAETASALLLHAQHIQISYGAVILSFLGAIHWGFEFSKYGGVIGSQRYALGVLPVVLAWPTMMLLSPPMALIGQFASFVAMWFVDLRATTEGWVPIWYSTYRFWLSLVVGSSILATLAGIGYYAPASSVPVRPQASKLAEQVQANAPTKLKLLEQSAKGDKGGVVKHLKADGNVTTTSGGDEGDRYVIIRKRNRNEEEQREKQEEDNQKLQFQKQQQDFYEKKANEKVLEGKSE